MTSPLPLSAARAVRALAAALSVCALPLGAQAVAGLGDDAIPVPRGGFRIGVGGLWNDYRDVWARQGEGSALSRRPLLGPLDTDAFGVSLLPQLAATQDGIRALSGQSAFTLSLGTLDAAGEVRQSIAPITLDYGVTRRLSLRVVVPYVESRDATQLLLNRNGTGANVGRNPAYGTTGAEARSRNAQLLAQLDAAGTALRDELTRCAAPDAPNCAAISANPAAAEQLLTRTVQTRTQLATLYGDGTRGGAPVVPIIGSTVHGGVVQTIETLRTAFGAYGISAIPTGASPAAATLVLGPASIGTVAGDTSFNVGYERLGDTRRAGIGDVDLTATYLLFDTFGADQRRRIESPRRGVRTSVTAGWRFGTAGADRTEDAFDVPIGEGANALLLRSTTDVLFNRWAWLSATMRAVAPMGDQVAVVLPFRDVSELFAAPVRVGSAARSLGTRVDLELAPRVSIGQFFGLSTGLLLRRWGADQYDVGNDASSEPAVSRLEVPSRTMTAAAFGASFSTLASYLRGRSRFPAEVIYTHTRPLSASGGTVPVMVTDRLELRVYTGFPRR